MESVLISFSDLDVLFDVHAKHGQNVSGNIAVDASFPCLFDVTGFCASWESCSANSMGNLGIELSRGFIWALPHFEDHSL